MPLACGALDHLVSHAVALEQAVRHVESQRPPSISITVLRITVAMVPSTS